MENVLQLFYIFYDFLGIRKYFLDSTDFKILKIEFHESVSSKKIWKKLFLNSPYKSVHTNQILDFSEDQICFHRTFIKNIEKYWKILTNLEIHRYSYFLNCARKLLKISKMNSTYSRDLIDQVLDTQLTYRWFPKDFKKYEYRSISVFFNIFNESPMETQLDLGKI